MNCVELHNKEATMIGYFLIRYLTVFLTRILQFQTLNNHYCTENLFEFIHNFSVAKISLPVLVHCTNFDNIILSLNYFPINRYYYFTCIYLYAFTLFYVELLPLLCYNCYNVLNTVTIYG
jgi:hypothetical protein